MSISPVNAPPPLGLWSAVKGGPAGLLESFDAAGAAPAGGALVWPLQLPEDVRLAAAQLEDTERKLQMAYPAWSRQNAQLQAELQVQMRDVPVSDPLESFGVEPGTAQPPWSAVNTFQKVAGQFVGYATNYARVDTIRPDKRLVARTVVTWGGDCKTWWGRPLTVQDASLHNRSLAMALSSRRTLVKTLGTVTRGAALAAMLLTAPASPLSAIIVLARTRDFIGDVLAALRA